MTRQYSSILALGVWSLATTLALAASDSAPVSGQIEKAAATPIVRVTPDHENWIYRPGESVAFRVRVTDGGKPAGDVPIEYSIGPEQMAAETKTAVIPTAGLTLQGGTMTKSGFLRCTVTAKIAGRTIRELATAAFSPEQLKPTQTEPADFDEFWRRGKTELEQVPLEPRLTLIPEACTATVDVYQISFRTIGPTWMPVFARIYGILCEPKAAGKYPVVLRLPGAGVRSFAGDKDLAAQGVITLEIGIHGIPVNLPQELYEQLRVGALGTYWLYHLDNPSEYYYRRVYLSCIRAVDFLTTRTKWNGKDLLTAGASQGGQLAIVTAALDSRVTGLIATHPAYCDVTGDLYGRAGGWPRPFARAGAAREQMAGMADKVITTGYYDVVNFSRRIKVPGFYLWGFNDETCPPTSLYAAYNVITAPKKLRIMPELGHNFNPAMGVAMNDWILRYLSMR